MTDRKRVWGARAILALIPVAILAATSPFKIHTEVWPFGHVSTLAEILGGGVAYVVMIAAASWFVLYVVIFLGLFAVVCLVRAATRRPPMSFKTYKRRW